MTFPDFDPSTDIVRLDMGKKAFLEKKPGAEDGPVLLGGIWMSVTWEEFDTKTVLTPMEQIVKQN